MNLIDVKKLNIFCFHHWPQRKTGLSEIALFQCNAPLPLNFIRALLLYWIKFYLTFN